MSTNEPETNSAEPETNSVARIMIVDDHALVRHGLAQLISDESDLDVCAQATSVEEGLQILEEANPDLVVIDISLKDGNGIDLIKRIRAKDDNVKMLVSSMHDETLFAERALHAGAQGYINKQEATEKVVDAIRSVLSGHIYLSAEMTDRLVLGATQGKVPKESSTISKLSDRELEVFELIGNGCSTREIATKLRLSIKTIETHREHIKDKLSLKNSAALSRHAVKWVLENS